MVDLDRRTPRHPVRWDIGRGELCRTSLWGCGKNPSAELGAAWLLRLLLSGTAALDRHRTVTTGRRATGFCVYPSVWGARSRMAIRCHDSVSRLDPRRRYIPDLRPQLAGSQQHRRIEHLLAHHLGLRVDSRVGTHTAVAESLASRPVSPRIRQSDRPGHLPDHGRLDLHRTAGPFSCRPRSTKHIELWLQHKFALAQLCLHEHLLRIGIYKWLTRSAVPGKLSARSHYVRSSYWQEFRRKIYRFSDCAECGQPTRAA